jgi:hypothetical protein
MRLFAGQSQQGRGFYRLIVAIVALSTVLALFTRLPSILWSQAPQPMPLQPTGPPPSPREEPPPPPPPVLAPAGQHEKKPPTQLDTDTGAHPVKRKKILALCVFYFAEENAVEMANLKHFLRHGIYPSDETMDYWIVLAAPTPVLNLSEAERLQKISKYFPASYVAQAANVRIVWEENRGTDLCLVAHLFKTELWQRTRRSYTHFWFMNGTVRGPFLPLYLLAAKTPWWVPFLSLMEQEPPVDAVGSWTSCDPYLHIQTMAMMMTQKAMTVAESTFYCQAPDEPRHIWINNTEVVRHIINVSSSFTFPGSSQPCHSRPIVTHSRSFNSEILVEFV